MEDGSRHHVDDLGPIGIDGLGVVGQTVGDDTVADGDGFGETGGAAGEQHQGGVVGVPHRGGPDAVRTVGRGDFLLGQDRTGNDRTEPLGELGAGHSHPRPHQFGQLSEFARGQVGIHLGGRRSEPRRGEDGRDRQCASQIDQGHPVAGAHPASARAEQTWRMVASSCAVGVLLAVHDQCHPVGDARPGRRRWRGRRSSGTPPESGPGSPG